MIRMLTAATLTLALSTPVFAQTGDMTHDPSQIKAGTYRLDKNHGKITWSVNHLGFSTYIGQFADTSAKLQIDPAAPERTLLNATVQTASIGTMNERLDDELKSDGWLNTDKNPTATFEATKIDVTGAMAKVTGNLTLNGITRPEELDVTFNQAGTNPVDHKYRLGFSGSMTIRRSDFGITKFVPMVSDEVPLQLEGEFVEASE
jgi:polyisoprenoid-binding protein YceI